MVQTISRRDFIKYAGGGIAVLVVGSQLSWTLKNQAYAQSVTSLDFHIADAMKEMHTHHATNDARCYFWVYKSAIPDLPAECPGPVIVATKGDTIQISITNDLDEPHAFFIPGMFDSGPIAPGQTVTDSFIPTTSGAHMYFDNLNEPVNRVMGLHGALIVMPSAPVLGHKFTPYDNPTSTVQKLYDDFGSTTHFPGLAWEDGDTVSEGLVPPFRQYVWLLHQASPNLFEEVGSLPAGAIYNAAQFMDAFLRDPFQPHAFHTDNPGGNRIAQYHTINGQSGHFSHNSATVTPMGRVGEPVVVHILNAGLWAHSMHLHANHPYVTCINGVVQANPIWLDTFNVFPMDRVDYTVPFQRPPDVPNERGIGMPETPLVSLAGQPVWPPVEEFDRRHPGIGEDIGQDRFGNIIDLEQRQSPLCYPMHDHSEPSQTSQGGNYNTGLISGMYFLGDRNTPAWMNFEMEADFMLMLGMTGVGTPQIRGITGTQPAAPPPSPPAP